jgi:hypothetical protein
MKLALMLTFVMTAWAGGDSCLRCHEMSPAVQSFRSSTHRAIACETCHGGTLQAANVRKGMMHLSGDVPEQLRIRHSDVDRLVNACRGCHQQQFADWRSGPHGSNYKRILLDPKHNAKTAVKEDCLRCHGMLFDGSVREAQMRAGGDLANAPVMPCIGCHSMHTRGEPGAKTRMRASLALWDRRDRKHIGAAQLPVPAMMQGDRAVKMSPDQRQALCYQCHAAAVPMQAASGDDRTALGVHEGLSCLACHQGHGQNATASCANCHPRLSNCGLDVEKMDTTFANQKSRHNIHFVACGDCHAGKRPVKSVTAIAPPRLTR